MRTFVPLVLVLAAGCLLRTSEPPRFFRPESSAIDGPVEVDPGTSATAAVPVRLRSVEAGPFLRERIVWRTSAVEYGQYEQRRWRELPAVYVERALSTALLATPGVRLSDDLHASALRAEVVAFDEVLVPAHVASVGIEVSLHDGARRLLEHTFTADVPIVDDDPISMARAMGHALDDVSSQVARSVAARLSTQSQMRQ
jgi:ABC-type uncharacterized transport system auxiliary subunit